MTMCSTPCVRRSRPARPRPTFAHASRYFDLGAQAPLENWPEAFKHLPEQDMLKAINGEPGIFADSEPNVTGGRMIQRTPNDPAWFRGGLYHDDMVIDVPGLYLVSWYDVSVGPNLALFNHVRQTASPGRCAAAVRR